MLQQIIPKPPITVKRSIFSEKTKNPIKQAKINFEKSNGITLVISVFAIA